MTSEELKQLCDLHLTMVNNLIALNLKMGPQTTEIRRGLHNALRRLEHSISELTDPTKL